jgi:hypothetical protein
LTLPINWLSGFFFSYLGINNVKESRHINLVTYRLNALSDDPVSQVFYLFYKELRFGNVHSHPSG